MTQQEVVGLIEEITEAPAGSVQGNELLSAVPNWDSLAVVSFLASVHAAIGVTLEPKRLKECKSIPDLVTLVQSKVAK